MTVPAPEKDLSNLTDEEVRDLGRLNTSSGINLDEEQFNTAQELTKLTALIGEARQTLADLDDTKEEWILKQEKQALDRVLAVIQRSKEALRGATENHDELRALMADMKELTKRILALRDSYLEMGKRFKEEADEIMRDIGNRSDEVEAQARQNKDDRRVIDASREEVAVQKAALKVEEEKLASQRQEIENGFAELRKAKQ